LWFVAGIFNGGDGGDGVFVVRVKNGGKGKPETS
jgi:hypothetical protein